METKRKTTFPAFLSTFVLCFLFWILFTGSFAWQELVVGVVVSALVAWFSARFFVHERPFGFFGKRLPINPGIIRVPADVPTEYGKTMLANSITLTPGTITMDIDERDGQCWYYIHWIDVQETDRVQAGEAIKGRMEKWLRRIWQ